MREKVIWIIINIRKIICFCESGKFNSVTIADISPDLTSSSDWFVYHDKISLFASSLASLTAFLQGNPESDVIVKSVFVG